MEPPKRSRRDVLADAAKQRWMRFSWLRPFLAMTADERQEKRQETSAADLKFLRSSGKLKQERQIQKPHWNHYFASVFLIPKFASEPPPAHASFGTEH
jgi:hypothetical protein